MQNQKQLWEELAKKNSKYYINSDYGRKITDTQFRDSGKNTYDKFIANDKFITTRNTVLDYGCGTGRLMEFMSHDFKKVIGVDISPTMILEGKKRLTEFDNVEFLETDGETIPLANDSVDFVFSYLVFQHIKTQEMVEATFKEIYRVLNTNGVFKVLLRTDKQKDMNNWWAGVNLDEETIKKIYMDIGFKLLNIEHIDSNSYWLWLTKSKWEKGKNNTLKFYKAKLPWKAKSFNSKLFNLPEYFAPMIGNKTEVKIAEIGSGMFCSIGSLWKSAKVEVFASDALATEFNEILKEANVIPLIPVVKEDMENLSYPDEFFDIVHSCNALDHTVNPIRAIKEMYRVVKPGGYIYLRHFPNVGELEGYQGLHMWNLNIEGKDDCVIWNKNERHLLSNYFNGFKTVMKKEMEYETSDMVVSILKKD